MKDIFPLIVMSAFILFVTGCANRAPKTAVTFDNPLQIHYFECSKCQSLDGGVYGKRSISSYRTAKGANCWHRWKEISGPEFDTKWKERVGTTEHF